MYKLQDYLKRGFRFLNNHTRTSHKKLSTLMIYATDLCDSKCRHCLIWKKDHSKGGLSLEKIVEIMQNKCISKDTVVGLEGGEFLLHPEAMPILEWFSKNHPKFDLLSNALKPQNVIEAVKKYPPKRLFLSLDGGSETYKYMRGRDGYDKVIQVIEECKDAVPISVMFTLSPYNNFDDLQDVLNVCKKYNIDIRIGIYNNIAFFDTVHKAHGAESEIAQDAETTKVNDDLNRPDFKNRIPEDVKNTFENYDFMLLYDEWRQQNLKLKCYSILDSLVIHPNGDVPICQNSDLKLGNIFEESLDVIFNKAATRKTHKEYSQNCNQCWINFHRKYDIVLMRNAERFFSKKITETLFGKYRWCKNPAMTYKKFMKQYQ